MTQELLQGTIIKDKDSDNWTLNTFNGQKLLSNKLVDEIKRCVGALQLDFPTEDVAVQITVKVKPRKQSVPGKYLNCGCEQINRKVAYYEKAEDFGRKFKLLMCGVCGGQIDWYFDD